MLKREDIAYYAYRYDGNWDAIAEAVSHEETPVPVSVKEPYITLLDDAYPACLKQLRYPPWILFYRGDASLLQKPMAAIVGSRTLTPYGAALTVRCAAS